MGWRCSCCVNLNCKYDTTHWMNSENECNSIMKWQLGLRLFSFMMFNFGQPFVIPIWTTQSLSIRFRLWKWCKYITHKLRVSITIFFSRSVLRAFENLFRSNELNNERTETDENERDCILYVYITRDKVPDEKKIYWVEKEWLVLVLKIEGDTNTKCL